jgi:ribosomal protein S18 acetylase RimI-like enzyme
MSVFVRTAGPRDIGAIQSLLKATWHATYDGFYGADEVDKITAQWHSTARLSAMMERDRSEYLVADDGQSLCGVAYAAAEGEDARVVTLFQLYVHPDLQGRGIGGMLLEEIEDSFFESQKLRLEVEERNARAIAFYRSQGFAEVGRLEQCGDVATTVLVLEKALA